MRISQRIVCSQSTKLKNYVELLIKDKVKTLNQDGSLLKGGVMSRGC